MARPVNQALLNAQILTRRVDSALSTHAVAAANAYDAKITLEGKEPAIGGDAFIKKASASLLASLGTYVASQGKLDQEETEDQDSREARDEATSALRRIMVDLGSAIDAAFGPEGRPALGVGGAVPVSAEELHVFVKSFLNTTSGPNFKAPAPRSAFSQLDIAFARAQVEAGAEALGKTLDATSREQRETQAARSQRDTDYADWYAALRYGRNTASNVLIRTGKRDLAERILPTSRQLEGLDPIEDAKTDPPEPPSDIDGAGQGQP